ncbi:hypothetical protein HK105_206218 [Polyrhizophydium stewartii]|uniref:CST complex subunit CTC1 n=1 Tax=Polyrhizophydium stewartii TaxID=2732419 RepID=A0ABR4N418_9FUNG
MHCRIAVVQQVLGAATAGDVALPLPARAGRRVLSNLAGAAPVLLVLCGRIGARPEARPDDPPLQLSDSSGAVPCVLADAAVAAAAAAGERDMLVWEWQLVALPAGGGMLLEVVSATPLASAPVRIRALAEFDFEVDAVPQLDAAPPTEPAPIAQPRSGLASVRGSVIARMPVQQSAGSALLLVRIACDEALPAASAGSTVLLFKDKPERIAVLRQLMTVRSVLDFCDFKPQRLAIGPSSSFRVLAHVPGVSSCNPQQLHRAQPSDPAALTQRTIKALPRPFEAATSFDIASCSHTIISYSGIVTGFVDAALGILVLDHQYTLVCTLAQRCPEWLSLRRGTAVHLSSVHLFYSTPAEPVYLVMCPASTLDIESFATEPASDLALNSQQDLPHLPAAGTAFQDLATAISFPDLAKLITIKCTIANVLDARQISLKRDAVHPDASALDVSTQIAPSLLWKRDHKLSNTGALRAFLDHDAACTVPGNYTADRPILSVPNVLELLSPPPAMRDSRQQAAGDIVICAESSATSSAPAQPNEGNDRRKSSVDCIGLLCSDAAKGRLFLSDGRDAKIMLSVHVGDHGPQTCQALLGHLVIATNARLVCERIPDAASAPSSSGGAPEPVVLTAEFIYLEVDARDIQDLGSPTSPAPAANAQTEQAPAVQTSLVRITPRARRAPILQYTVEGEAQIETVLECTAVPEISSDGAEPDAPASEVTALIRFVGEACCIPDLLALDREYSATLPKGVAASLLDDCVIDWPDGAMLSPAHAAPGRASSCARADDATTSRAGATTAGKRIATGWSETLASLNCRIVTKRIQRATTPGYEPVFAYPASDSDRDSRHARQRAQRHWVGLGDPRAVLVLHVEDLATKRLHAITCDVRMRAYPLGLLPGRCVRIDNLGVRLSRYGDEYYQALSVTSFVVQREQADELLVGAVESGAIGVAGQRDWRRQQHMLREGSLAVDLPHLRLSWLVSRDLAPHTAVLDAHVINVASATVSLVCQRCRCVLVDSTCPSSCADAEKEMTAQAVLFVDDGTAEAAITISTIDQFMTAFAFGAAEERQMVKQLEAAGTISYVARFLAEQDTHSTPMAGAASISKAQAQAWLERQCIGGKVRRRLRFTVSVRSSDVVDFDTLDPPPSETCVASASRLRKRRLNRGERLAPLDTVSPRAMRLHASAVADLAPAALARYLMERLALDD